MNHRCPCQCENYEATAMFYRAMAEVMTEKYAVLYKPMKRNWIFFTTDYINKEFVRLPKEYENDYEEKKIQCIKEILSLIDRGYSSPIPEELEVRYREAIAEYQMNKNEVWE
jgi:hypothetical protein